MSLVHLQKVDPATNKHRYYRISLWPTLFGQWALIREWGRIGRSGRRCEHWFDNRREALNAGAVIERRKRHRGYTSALT